MGKLKQNIKYKSGEYKYLYETENMGRINKFETDNLQLTERGKRLSHNSDTPGKLDGDHAGHLAGDRFGGKAFTSIKGASNPEISRINYFWNKYGKISSEELHSEINDNLNPPAILGRIE